jgi:hypothetical protein
MKKKIFYEEFLLQHKSQISYNNTMAKEFTCRVGQSLDDPDFSWVIKGLGSYVSITRVERVSEEEMDQSLPEGEGEFIVYHTGPNEAINVVHGEGFIFPSSASSLEDSPKPRPWKL